MLDIGEPDFAYQIARTGLEVWKREVEASYNCMEHFLIATGRGAGWHEFGGLSTPVLSWYSAYFRPGNFTTGFNIWTGNKKFNSDFSNLTVDLTIYDKTDSFCSVIACMNPTYTYQVSWNGNPVTCKTFSPGTLSIDLPVKDAQKGTLRIEKTAN